MMRINFFNNVIFTPIFYNIFHLKALKLRICNVDLKNSDLKKYSIFIIVALFFIFLKSYSYALNVEDRIGDEKMESRAMSLFLKVKCIVCSGQSVESSNTQFSSEMRKLIRKKILEGKGDDEILQDLTQEFGDEILISSYLNEGVLIAILLSSCLVIAILFVKNFIKKHDKR